MVDAGKSRLRVRVHGPQPGDKYYLTPIMEQVVLDLLGEEVIDIKEHKFADFTNGLVKNFLEKGKLPENAAVQATVINLAEDYTAGRDMVIRAGDYIALRQYQKQLESH